jgi:hypothetical protein
VTNRPYRFGKVDTDHPSDLGDLLVSRPTNRATRVIAPSKWMMLYVESLGFSHVHLVSVFKFQTLCVLLSSRLISVSDFVAGSHLISVSDCGLLLLNLSFKLVTCYHAIFPVVLNCKMHSLHMYKR